MGALVSGILVSITAYLKLSSNIERWFCAEMKIEVNIPISCQTVEILEALPHNGFVNKTCDNQKPSSNDL